MIKTFYLFIFFHMAAWTVTHVYLTHNAPEILLIVDTSYVMKPKFEKMKAWINDLESSSRYNIIIIGTDKALLGGLEQLESKDMIFRTSFGRMNKNNLNRYMGKSSQKKILLSDGLIEPEGWEVVSFK